MAGLLPDLLLVLLAGVVPASAKDYPVGDSSGWTTGVDYNAWAKGKRFNVGDTLLFQYNAVHSVAEVSAADHGACSASNPLQSYRDQNTTIALTKAGTRYFICGTSGHCAIGMKLAVTVAISGGKGPAPAPAARSTKPSSPDKESPPDTTPAAAAPATTAAPTTKTSTNASSATGRGTHLATGLLLGAVGLAALTG